MKEFSDIGQQLTSKSGIDDLMEDLFKALHSGRTDLCQLNGGSPAVLPEVSELWRTRMMEMIESGEFDSLVGTYAHPRGDVRFITALVNYLNERYHWGLTLENVAITQGGQMAFFTLFNVLAGKKSSGEQKEILFPLCPDYIGYQSQSLCGAEVFRGIKPDIELIGDHEFKYKVNFDLLEIRPETAAMCLSRPTNPTGNVVSDEELAMLHQRAKKANIPILVDNAYGAPFPNICFVENNPIWDEHVVLSMSLSKIGLPGTRTGIVIARPEIIDAVIGMTTTSALCPNNLGQKIVAPLIEDGRLDTLCHDTLLPFYYDRSLFARKLLNEYFGNDVPWRHHKSEGAMFLWLWFEGLPISSQELYERCRDRGCYINPGHHFFFAVEEGDEPWNHRHECVRISFTATEDALRRGLSILAEEVKKAYQK